MQEPLHIVISYSCMQVAATFGIPIVRTEIVAKRKREDVRSEAEDEGDEEGQPHVSEPADPRLRGCGGGSGGMLGSRPAGDLPVPKNKSAGAPVTSQAHVQKKRSSHQRAAAVRFQNTKLVKAINSKVGLEVRFDPTAQA